MYSAVYVHTIRKCTLVLVLPNSASILVKEPVKLVPLHIQYLSTRLQAAFMRPSPPMCVCERVCVHVHVYVYVFCVCDSSRWSMGCLSSRTDRETHTRTQRQRQINRERRRYVFQISHGRVMSRTRMSHGPLKWVMAHKQWVMAHINEIHRDRSMEC